MAILIRVLLIAVCAALLGFPAAAQNPGGLPGLEHTLARVAFLNAERVVIHGDVVHYRFDVAVGPGEFDVIRIHRVVKETTPGRPVKKMEGVLLLPGAPQPSVELFFTNGDRFVTLMANSPPYVPYQWNYDNNAARCGSDDYPVTFDDHLGEITVPIFLIARQSGGLYTASLTASDDVSSLIINATLNPSLYGHADSFLADSAANTSDNAANKIWRPILDWILAHR